MKRRAVMAGLAVAWPVAAGAQQRVPRLGLLFAGPPEPHLRMFRDGLRTVGLVDGQTVRLELRSGDPNPDRLATMAAEFVGLKVDLIVAFQTPSVEAARRVTREVPIVMASAGDPVATGLIASLARPGGNITGMASATSALGGKTLELIREMLPRARRVAVLANATDPFTGPFLEQIEAGARMIGLTVQPIRIGDASAFDAAFAAMQRDGAEAFIHQPSLPRRGAIALGVQYRLPSISPSRAFAEDGGLMSYAANLAVQYRTAAGYVDRILKGARPAELPVAQPTVFELVVNLKTALLLGLTLPASLLERADEVIE